MLDPAVTYLHPVRLPGPMSQLLLMPTAIRVVAFLQPDSYCSASATFIKPYTRNVPYDIRPMVQHNVDSPNIL